MYYLIYLVTNLINHKKYIGQTKMGRLDQRINEHILDIPYTKDTCIFHAALAKYGIDNFSIEVIEDNIPEENIDDREKYYIKKYDTYYKDLKGYNMTFGGQGTHGYVFTEEDRAKLSLAQKNYWLDLKEHNLAEYERLCEIRRQNKLGST